MIIMIILIIIMIIMRILVVIIIMVIDDDDLRLSTKAPGQFGTRRPDVAPDGEKDLYTKKGGREREGEGERASTRVQAPR